jgi:acyl-CoA thioester hydrolase/thioesterase-3
MNNHVHMSKYLDYVLFARYDQMARCYGMAMDEFVRRGWGWYVKSCTIEYRRALSLDDRVVVQTWLESFGQSDVRVGFRILRKDQRKISADGEFLYTMVNLATNRAEPIPEWVKERYQQFVEEE